MWRHSGHRGPAAWQAMSTEPLTCRPGFGSPACSLFGGRLQKACCIVVHLSAEGICLQWAELCQRAFALHAQIFPQWCKDSHHKCVPAAESEPWQAAGAGGRGAVSVPACLLLCAGAPVCGCSPGADPKYSESCLMVGIWLGRGVGKFCLRAMESELWIQANMWLAGLRSAGCRGLTSSRA